MRRTAATLFLVLVGAIASAVAPRTFSLDDPIYARMELLYISSGMGPPSNSKPWSSDEARLMLDRIDESTLSDAELRLYRQIEESIGDDFLLKLDDVASIGLGGEANLEMYAHSNSSFSHEDDWLYGYDERKPLLSLCFDWQFFDTVYSFADVRLANGKYRGSDQKVDLKQKYPGGIGAIVPPASEIADIPVYGIEDSEMYSPHFTHNVLTSFADFDSIFPKRAFMNVGGEHFLVSFGRDRVDWGNSNISNLVIDDHVDYHDYLRFTFFSDKFKYEFLTLFLEYDVSCSQTEDEGSKFLIGHRLEFRPVDRLTFSLSENVMYVSQTGIELKYFNPAFIFHNLDNHSIFNAIAYVDIDWQFARNFNLYTQVVLDQATAPGEGDDQSPAWGMLVGLEYAKVLDEGGIKTSLEAAYTSPLLYRRDAVDFLILDKNKLSTSGGYVIDVDFLGFRYGNDALVIQSETDWTVKDGIDLNLTLRQTVKGSLDIYTSHASTGNNADRPDLDTGFFYGDVHFSTTAALSCEVALHTLVGFSYPQVHFSSSLAMIAEYGKMDEPRTDFQFTLSAGIAF